MGRFFNMPGSFFDFVRKHCGAFFWLCWLYYVALLVLQIVFAFSETAAATALIPMNLVAWPVFWEARTFKGLPLPVRRTVWLLPLASTLLPLLLLFEP